MKPTRRFNVGDDVSIPVKYFGWSNGVIVGYEWGESHRDYRRNVWLYWVRPSHAYSNFAGIIAEDEMGAIT